MKTRTLNVSMTLLALAILTSCVKGDISCGVPITVSSSVNGLVESKANNSAWDANDEIGIFMVTNASTLSAASIVSNSDNISYFTSGDGNFSPVATEIFLPESGNLVDFISYYPHSGAISNYVYPIDITTQNPQKNIDLLYSGTVSGLSKTSSNVNFTFDHKLSKIYMTIAAGAGVSPLDLSSITVKITNMNTKADFDLATGNILNQNTPATITAFAAANGTSAEAIVMPGTGTGRVIEFTLQNGSTFKWNILDTYDFPSGKRTLYTVTIQKIGVTVTSSITPWGKANGDGEPIVAE